jgi:SAM-dependent methyltransferase
MLNQMGFEVISLDVSSTALKIGSELARRHPVFGDQPPHDFLRFDGRRIELPNASIDRIFCLDALHHVPDQRLVLAEMSRILRTGGVAGFVEPGPAHSRDPLSQLEMRNFKVIENDIVLDDIIAIARSVGFTDIELTVGTIHPPRVSLERFKQFPGDTQFASEFLDATAQRVHNFPIFFLRKGRAAIDDSRDMSGLRVRIATARSVRAARGSRVILHATFDNISGKRWLSSGAKPGSVNIGYFIHRVGEDSGLAKGTEYRAHLSSDIVEPGARVDTTIDLGVLEPGRYRVDIDLVSEHVRWFQTNGSEIASVDVSVA